MDKVPVTGLEMSTVIILLLAFIIVEFYISLSCNALKSVNRSKLRSIAENGNRRAQSVLDYTENPEKISCTASFFSAILLILSGLVIVIPSAFHITEHFGREGFPFILSFIISLAAMMFVFIVFGRLYPQLLAERHSETISLKTVNITRFISIIVSPFLFINSGASKLLLKIGRQDKKTSSEEFSEEEVMDLLETGQEKGAIKEEGKKMIDSIFAFDDKLAYEIMTPRTNVFAIDIEDPPEEYMDELMELTYSRIPVYRNDIDNIIGILNIKDYFRKARECGFEETDISSILRDPYFVPETKNIDALFFELQKSKQHIAILIDEYGGFAGIVTLEDIIEEVMGDIDDEYDEEENEIIRLSDNTYSISGFMDIDDLNEELNTDLSSDNSETIGGLIMEVLGEIPDEDDIRQKTVDIDKYAFRILSVKDRHIERVELSIKSDSVENTDSGKLTEK